MANRDINLFKAAGGDRAKGSKTSPMTYMLLFALIMIVAAIGVVVYFNMQANTVEQELKRKKNIQQNYELTKIAITNKSNNELSLYEEYKEVQANIESAEAIDEVILTESALYPHASDTETKAVENKLLEVGLSVNQVEQGEKVVPWDYETIRKQLYDEMNDATPDSDEYLKKGTFYYALRSLSEAQKKSAENVWFGYYRCYFVLVCEGEQSPDRWNELIEELLTMDASPFMHISMQDQPYFSPVLRASTVLEDNNATYNVLLLPLKSVVERVYDLLDSHARDLCDQNDYFTPEQIEKASYALSGLEFANTELKFNLILHKDALYRDYIKALDDQVFFDVDDTIYDDDKESDQSESEGNLSGEYRIYPVILHYIGRTASAEGRN